MLPERFWVTKCYLQFICKEKTGTVTKLKLITKNKLRKLSFILELWY